MRGVTSLTERLERRPLVVRVREYADGLFVAASARRDGDPLRARLLEWAGDLQRLIALRELDAPPSPVGDVALAAWRAEGREAAERARATGARVHDLRLALRDEASWRGAMSAAVWPECRAAHDVHVAAVAALAASAVVVSA
jgi:hypothetical protein